MSEIYLILRYGSKGWWGRLLRDFPFLWKTTKISKSWTLIGIYLVETIGWANHQWTFISNVIGCVWDHLRPPQKNNIVCVQYSEPTVTSAWEVVRYLPEVGWSPPFPIPLWCLFSSLSPRGWEYIDLLWGQCRNVWNSVHPQKPDRWENLAAAQNRNVNRTGSK
jgi:hypothetical protein